MNLVKNHSVHINHSMVASLEKFYSILNKDWKWSGNNVIYTNHRMKASQGII
jgi:hypothetical protein